MTDSLSYALRTFNPDGSRRPQGLGEPFTAGIYAGAAAAQSGRLPPPAAAGAAAGNSPLIVSQSAMAIGEPIPIVFGRRRGNIGGVLVFPRATEARFENDSTTVTARYHCVLGEGLIPDVEVRDVRHGECRIGSFSQNYGTRAGSWTPGNFATAQSGYTVPTFPTFTGGGGNYQGLSTIEFGATFPGGSDDWRTGWNVFLRGGLTIERGRLLDSVVGPSDNLADLVLWALERSGRVPAGMIDTASLSDAALFLEANNLWCNGEFNESGNLGDWLLKILPDFLLRETRVGGKFGLRPLLPVNGDGTINTDPIVPIWVLSEAAIVPDSYQVEYHDAASRRPAAMAMLWRQQYDATEPPIVRTLTVGDQNAAGPVEQHDLSRYATNEDHAARVGAYLAARRTLSTHAATVKLKPGNQSGLIAEGDIVQIYLSVTSSRESPGVINRFYQVESVGSAITGEETLQLSHFPVDASGRSLIALAVAGATAPGQTLSSQRTGSSCDLPGAAASTTVPAKSTSGTPLSSQGSSYWAAGGQFIDLFSGARSPATDAPPIPGANSGTVNLAQGGGAIPPTDGSSSLGTAGGDNLCPFGYNRFSGYINWYQLTGPNDISGRTTYFTATAYPTVANGASGTFGVWTYKEKIVSWTDPAIGAQSVTVSAASGTNGTATVSMSDFEVTVTSYACSTESGAAGPNQSAKLYRAQQGDTWEDMSRRFYGTPSRADDIKNANSWLMGINGWALITGTQLVIPN